MEFEKICFSSKAIDIAENDLYLEHYIIQVFIIVVAKPVSNLQI